MGLGQQKSSSRVSIRERFAGRAGACVLWPVHSRGCPVNAPAGNEVNGVYSSSSCSRAALVPDGRHLGSSKSATVASCQRVAPADEQSLPSSLAPALCVAATRFLTHLLTWVISTCRRTLSCSSLYTTEAWPRHSRPLPPDSRLTNPSPPALLPPSSSITQLMRPASPWTRHPPTQSHRHGLQ